MYVYISLHILYIDLLGDEKLRRENESCNWGNIDTYQNVANVDK